MISKLLYLNITKGGKEYDHNVHEVWDDKETNPNNTHIDEH